MKTVLVTGSSQGIGLQLVRHYVKEGWKVIATARNPNNSKEVLYYSHSSLLSCV